ncbi:NYN domain-containing protein [Isoptericola sp. b441]|uniref:NYN domain-containing protein n=1 Tax=Actinotalea lenta TaxID=3064654 RepID=A0ABT9DCB3_9CELL|nr:MULTISPECIES: NYN domain-containing protein [unclassified Isoptericola]MDO8108526.1 NYN domain-containing protein [Isoptericola sp. b441]MDO8119936.1 NYN domain-containing protein [Isoptericola sp. b490]
MAAQTYLLVDGENIDATLGGLLGARPNPEQRPRWERVLEHARTVWGAPTVRGLFFLNASAGTLPTSFVQALIAIGFTPVPLAGTADVKVVDVGIQRTLEALASRPGDVLLASHDGDFAEHLQALLGTRRVGLLAFSELISSSLRALTEDGLELFDLENDVHAFQVRLPRVRIIPLEEFDPAAFL